MYSYFLNPNSKIACTSVLYTDAAHSPYNCNYLTATAHDAESEALLRQLHRIVRMNAGHASLEAKGQKLEAFDKDALLLMLSFKQEDGHRIVGECQQIVRKREAAQAAHFLTDLKVNGEKHADVWSVPGMQSAVANGRVFENRQNAGMHYSKFPGTL